MAIDAPVPRSEAVRLPFGVARVAALPARLVLGGIVALSFVFRFLAALLHTTPSYFPDEYIYASIARSLAEDGRPLVRGGPAHFPAMLEPILAAPFWLFGDPGLAYRLTQAENALLMSLAAVPAYLIVRRLGAGTALALAAAALTVASPDLFFSAFVLADGVAYPLVLGAVYVGIRVLEQPTRWLQVAFVALCGLATFARVQYVVLPLVFVAAALVVERARPLAVLRRYPLALGLFAAPLVAAVAAGPTRVLGYYSVVVDREIRPGAILHWVGTDAMLLAYAVGWVIVPGALVGLAYALVRPRSRAEHAFAALFTALTVCIFAEAALYATNGSPRFQERYFMTLLPLVFPAFCLWLRRGRPARAVTCLAAVALLGLSARVPLSGFTMGSDKQDSPFLFAVFWLERQFGVGNGSLAVAVVAAFLSALAVAAAFRTRLAAAAVGAAIVVSVAVSVGAIAFDRLVTDSVRAAYLPPDAGWIDRTGVRDALLVQTPATPHARAHQQLFWNRSLTDVAFLGAASPIDAFRGDRLEVADDGRLLARGRAVHRPLAISNYAVTAQLTGAVRVAEGADYELWRPVGTPRLALLLGGRYRDSWLAHAGSVTVWPDASRRVRGTLRLVLSLPPGTQRTTLRFSGGRAIDRAVTISPGEAKVVELRADARGPWSVRFRAPRPGYLGERKVSVQAAVPSFTREGAAPRKRRSAPAI